MNNAEIANQTTNKLDELNNKLKVPAMIEVTQPIMLQLDNQNIRGLVDDALVMFYSMQVERKDIQNKLKHLENNRDDVVLHVSVLFNIVLLLFDFGKKWIKDVELTFNELDEAAANFQLNAKTFIKEKEDLFEEQKTIIKEIKQIRKTIKHCLS